MLFTTLARLRRAPAFHPRGVLLTGELSLAEGSASAAALGPGRRRVVARLSKGAGTPGHLPDLLGVAVRVPSDSAPVAVDLLFTSSIANGTLLAAARGWRAATYSTLLRHTTRDGPVRLLLEPVPRAPLPRADPAAAAAAAAAYGLEFQLVEQPRGRAGRPAGTLVLTARTEGQLAFDPVVHTHPDLAATGWWAELRKPAYRGSRRGRAVELTAETVDGTDRRTGAWPADHRDRFSDDPVRATRPGGLAAHRVRWRERSRLVRAVRMWRTRNPRTFRDKVRYKMLRDRRGLVVTFADKAAVRDHVAAAVGEHYLPHVYGIVDDPARLRDLVLPAAYVVKPTHGSGAAIIVSDRASAGSRLPAEPGSWVYRHVRPSSAPRDEVVRIAEGWVAQLYGRGPNHEWAYGRVPRRIVVEELLVGVDGAIPDDYKFFVFHGRCAFVQVDSGRFGHRTQDFFRPDWQHLPLSGGPPWAEPEPAEPACLAEMLEVAERLGAGTDFVRVDLYDVDGRVVFGELTSFPAGGDSPFDPECFDEVFGRPWTVPRRYR